MSEHTKGPYTYMLSEHGSYVIICRDTDMPPQELCQLLNDPKRAAAPELLEACRDAAIRLEVGDDTDNPTYRRLAEAIAKAAGE